MLPGLAIEPVLGEFAWHSITTDPTILDVSKQHFQNILNDLEKSGLLRDGLRILEVGAYAHVTGYMLARTIKASVTLADISQTTLSKGYELAMAEGLQTDNVERVACDFHALPFESNKYDVVYIASALHHTWLYQSVLAELARVTAKGGILILEEEPLRRELCFYEFRTNRPEEFDKKEIQLERSGLLRTIAEPYYGSRAELLFGMTENQEMELSEIINGLSDAFDVDCCDLIPSKCMGELERKIDEELLRSSTGASDLIFKIVREYIDEAEKDAPTRSYLTQIKLSQSCNYHKLRSLIERISKRLDLSNYQSELITTDKRLGSMISNEGAVERLQLNRTILFGGSIRLVASKKALSEQIDFPPIKNENTTVSTGFNANLDSLMTNVSQLFPNIQKGNRDDVIQAFGDDWEISEANGIVYAIPMKLNPEISIDHDSDSSLLVSIRVYAVVEDVPWTLGFFVDDELRAHVEFTQSGTALLVASISNAISPNTLRLTSISDLANVHFNVPHVSVVSV